MCCGIMGRGLQSPGGEALGSLLLLTLAGHAKVRLDSVGPKLGLDFKLGKADSWNRA